MSDSLAAIQGNIAAINAAVNAIPSEIAAAATSGNFSQVLAEIQQSLASMSPVAATQGSTGITGGLTNLMAPLTPSVTSSGASPSGANVVATAEQFLGVPYVWGGSTPQGFDCSGLVQFVYAQLGIPLARTSQEQAMQGVSVPSLAAAQPGDLVFYPGSDGTPSAPGHVGIYVGNGQMIDAPQTGESVQIQPVGEPIAIRRVLPESAVANTNANGTTNSSIPASLQPLFLAATSQYGLPPGLLPAVASVESNFQPNETSSAGAVGIMQIMPSTASGLGINPLDPAQAINAAAGMLSGYLRQFGSIPLALAAYNAGPAAVAQSGGVPPYAQTQSYVQAVMNRMGSLQ